MGELAFLGGSRPPDPPGGLGGGSPPGRPIPPKVSYPWARWSSVFDIPQVIFSAKEKSKAKTFTLFGLLAKLSLEGYPDVPVNCHDIENAGSAAGGLSRFKVTCAQARVWRAKNPTKKRKEPEEPPAEKAPGDWEAKDALACVSDTSQIPNQYVKILWYCDLVTAPEPVVRLVSPALCWTRTIDFQENQVIQFA